MPTQEPDLKMDLSLEQPVPEPVALPEGYRLVTLQPDSQLADWAAVLSAAFPEDNPWTVERLVSEFVDKPQFDAKGTFLAYCGDEPVACALAWRDTPDSTEIGRLHWVGTVPGHRGKHLGRAVVVAVIRYFAEHHFKVVTLDTQHYRPPAVNLYLSLGFVPDYRGDLRQLYLWTGLLKQLLAR